MGMVKSSGITEPLATKANSIRERRMVREDLTGRTAAIMKVSSSTVSSKVLVSTILQTLTRLTKVSLGCQTWKEEELRPGQMAVAMRAISRTARKTERAPLNGLMATSM